METDWLACGWLARRRAPDAEGQRVTDAMMLPLVVVLPLPHGISWLVCLTWIYLYVLLKSIIS